MIVRDRGQLAEALVGATEAYNLASARFTLKTAFIACVTDLVRMAAADNGAAALRAIASVWDVMEFEDVDDVVRWRVNGGRGRVTAVYTQAEPPRRAGALGNARGRYVAPETAAAAEEEPDFFMPDLMGMFDT